MRRYTLNISDREFVVDVQEIDADNFEVVVGDDTYQVSLAGDESLNETVITPGLAPAAGAPAGKAADTVTRCQQVAILYAMNMHNIICATQDGTGAEVYVAAGQSVDHGTPILKYKEA